MTTIVLKYIKKTEPFTTSATARSHFTARVLTLLMSLLRANGGSLLSLLHLDLIFVSEPGSRDTVLFIYCVDVI